MRSHIEHIDAIKLRLKRRADAESAEAPIVRDIVAYQVNDKTLRARGAEGYTPPRGEFNAERIVRDDMVFDEKKAAVETEDKLVARMFSYVRTLTRNAVSEHLEENFLRDGSYLRFEEYQQLYLQPEKHLSLQQYQQLIANHRYLSLREAHKKNPDDAHIINQINEIIASMLPQPKMKPDRKNHVTRFFLNEFALYPNEHKGPLTVDGFKLLLEKINTMASHYPENLQLILGSVPVMAVMKSGGDQKEKAIVHNVVIVADCGKPPKLHYFAKSNPDYGREKQEQKQKSGDPVYPGTSNAAAIMIPKREVTNRINELIRQLNESHDELSAKEIIYLSDYLKLNYPDLQKKPVMQDMLVLLDRIAFDVSEGVYKKAADKEQGDKQQKFAIQLATEQAEIDVELLSTHLEEMSRLLIIPREQLMLPFTELTDSAFGIHMPHGGNIHSTTAGGVRYRLAVDVCLDQHFGTAKGVTEREIQTAREKSEGTLPIYGSHALISNVIDLDTANVVSGVVTQADPQFSYNRESVHTVRESGEEKTVGPQRTLMDCRTPEFGSHTIVVKEEARKLNPLFEKLDKKTRTHNEFTVALRAMQLYREQTFSLDHLESVNKIINAHILDALFKSLHQWRLDRTFEKFQMKLLSAANQGHHDAAIEVLQQLKTHLTTKDASLSEGDNKIIFENIKIALSLMKAEQEKDRAMREKIRLAKPDKKRESKSERKLESKDDHSELHRAVTAGNFAKVETLLHERDAKKYLNKRDQGETPLHLAAARGDMGVMLLLLRLGADFFAENSQGKNFIEIFAGSYLNTPEFLRYVCADINFFHTHGDPPRSLLQHMMVVALDEKDQTKPLEKLLAVITQKNPELAYKQFKKMEADFASQAKPAEGKEKIKLLERQKNFCELFERSQVSLPRNVKFRNWIRKRPLPRLMSEHIAALEEQIAREKLRRRLG